MILFRYLLLALLSISLLSCGPVKDFTDQISQSIVGQDPIDPPASLKEFKAKLNPKILWSAKLEGDASLSAAYARNQQYTQLYTNGQLPVNNLLNPYSWAKLVKDWKEGKLTRQ